MSIRTIIEINHDCLPEVGGALAELVKMLPYASENEARERMSMSSGVRVLARRHHSYDMKVIIADSPDTPLPQYVPQSDAVELAKEMWLTLDGNRGYALTITAARTKRVAEEFLKIAAPDWWRHISNCESGK